MNICAPNDKSPRKCSSIINVLHTQKITLCQKTVLPEYNLNQIQTSSHARVSLKVFSKSTHASTEAICKVSSPKRSFLLEQLSATLLPQI